MNDMKTTHTVLGQTVTVYQENVGRRVKTALWYVDGADGVTMVHGCDTKAFALACAELHIARHVLGMSGSAADIRTALRAAL
jgi:hypothetical protein